MNKDFSHSLRNGSARWLLAGGLIAATLAGHLLTQGSGATPIIPSPPEPGTGGIDFASPGGASVSFTGKLDRRAVLEGGDGLVKMELVLAAEERTDTGLRGPTDFVVVLDRSGSMSGAKIEHARAAVRELISQLTAEDHFALVIYSSYAQVTIPLSPATPDAKQRWRQVVAQIPPGGGTNMSSALENATSISGPVPGRARRLILISDGLANEGDPTVEGLSLRARTAARQEMVVSTVGVGADFNEFLMSAVADAGTGNYYYLDDVEQLAQVFADELGATRETVASAVAVAVETGPGVQVIDAAGYPLEQIDGKTVFRPGSLFAGQERRIWVTLKVPNDAPGDRPLGRFTTSYTDQGITHVLGFDDPPVVACVRDEHLYHESFDKEVWARGAAEEDYGRLQERVAQFVKNGRRDEALREIGSYRLHNEQLNMNMKRQEIKLKLEELRRFQSEVEDAFEGADQAAKQNTLSKMNQAAGRDGRRAGSKRVQDKGDR